MSRYIAPASRKSKHPPQPVEYARHRVLAFGHAAMHLTPVAWTLERAGPEPRALFARRILFRTVVSIGDRPAGFDLAAVEIAAAGRACREQPVVFVALPSRTRDRPAADQRGERFARAAAAGIVGAIPAAGLIELR